MSNLLLLLINFICRSTVVDEFKDVVQHTLVHMHIPFSFDSDIVRLYFGKNHDRNVSYNEFTQLVNVRYSVFDSKQSM